MNGRAPRQPSGRVALILLLPVLVIVVLVSVRLVSGPLAATPAPRSQSSAPTPTPSDAGGDGAATPSDAGVVAPSLPAAVPFPPADVARILRHSPLPPAPLDPGNAMSGDARAAQFGQFLFFDARFSADGRVSCSTCHAPDKAFADGRALAQGLGQASRHAPSLWNVAHNRWYFWDGRADSLWAQALQPLENPVEQGTNRLEILRLVSSDPELRRAYQDLFGQLPELSATATALPAARPVAEDSRAPEHLAWLSLAPEERHAIDTVFSNVGKCIAAYVRLIRSARAPFDVFVEGLRNDDAGKLAALSPSAQRGLLLFEGRGNCRMCHSGPNFTDMEFHSVRAPSATRELGRDPGRYTGISTVLTDPFNGLGEFSDDRGAAAQDKLAYLSTRTDNQGQFKTPSLRNVAVTAPYMHQGQFATLRDVLTHYSEFAEAFDPLKGHFEQTLLPLHLTEQETEDLLAFLESLTDTALDPALMRQPDSPR